MITAVADAAGQERMTTAIVALLARRDPYAVDGGGSGTRASKAATWEDWLDAVDELALDPAGAPDGLAADLLVQYKVAPDPDALARRAEARRAYRALLAASPDWSVPVAIRAPLAAWTFDAASAAISAAAGTWDVTGETDATLAGVDARHGVVAAAWQGATSVSELRAAADLARRQLAAARDVAAARAALDQPLDLMQKIGMFATDVPGVDAAIVAVREGDDDAAAKAAAQIRGSVAALRATGEQRIVVGSTVALLLLAAIAFVTTRRAVARRAQRLEDRKSAAVVAVATAHPARVPVATAEPGRPEAIAGTRSPSTTRRRSAGTARRCSSYRAPRATRTSRSWSARDRRARSRPRPLFAECAGRESAAVGPGRCPAAARETCGSCGWVRGRWPTMRARLRVDPADTVRFPASGRSWIASSFHLTGGCESVPPIGTGTGIPLNAPRVGIVPIKRNDPRPGSRGPRTPGAGQPAGHERPPCGAGGERAGHGPGKRGRAAIRVPSPRSGHPPAV